MGIWEVVNSGTDAVKRNLPGFNTVLYACKTTCYYGATAVTKVDKVIRVDGIQRISSCMRDEKSRAQIGLFTSKLVQNTGQYAIKEGFKMLPGGKAVADIVDKTVQDTRLANQTSFQGNVAKKEIISGNGESEKCTTKRDMVEVIEEKQSRAMQIISEKSDTLEVTEKQGKEGMQIISKFEESYLPYPSVHKKPEDVLRVFMMKEFIGSRILDDLLVPQSRRGKGTHTNSDYVP